MTIEEICDKAGVTLAYFDNELWPRPGMILSDMKIIFVNKSLTIEAQKRVILHELGHYRAHKNDRYDQTEGEKRECVFWGCSWFSIWTSWDCCRCQNRRLRET
nr:MAG TPA: IrrE protein [Caudoviricetes sp.]